MSSRECPTSVFRSLVAILGECGPTPIFLHDGANPGNTLFIAKGPTQALEWIRGPGRQPEADDEPAAGALVLGGSRPQQERSPTRAEDPREIRDSDASEGDTEPLQSRKRGMADAGLDLGPLETWVSQRKIAANWRKEQRQRKKLNQKLSMAFVMSEEDVSKVGGSLTVERRSVFAWLGRQPGCGQLTATMAAKMVKKALAVGGAQALENWRLVLERWRHSGRLSYAHSTVSMFSPSSSAQDEDVIVAGFSGAFLETTGVETVGVVQDILYRQLLACLYEWYRTAEAYLLVESSGSSRGSGRNGAARVKAQLFDATFPGFKAKRERDDPAYKKKWKHFTRHLDKGQRWWMVRAELGLGMLALIPSSIVSHSWVERLPADQFRTWLELVQHQNPSVVELGMAIKETLNDALEGRDPPVDRLVLEEMEEEELKRMPEAELPRLLECASDSVSSVVDYGEIDQGGDVEEDFEDDEWAFQAMAA